MKPYGCHNTPRGDGYWARNGSMPVQDDIGFSKPVVLEAQTLVWVPDASSVACQYRLETPQDPRCKGCRK